MPIIQFVKEFFALFSILWILYGFSLIGYAFGLS